VSKGPEPQDASKEDAADPDDQQDNDQALQVFIRAFGFSVGTCIAGPFCSDNQLAVGS
jgi:hypothetical protein